MCNQRGSGTSRCPNKGILEYPHYAVKYVLQNHNNTLVKVPKILLKITKEMIFADVKPSHVTKIAFKAPFDVIIRYKNESITGKRFQRYSITRNHIFSGNFSWSRFVRNFQIIQD